MRSWEKIVIGGNMAKGNITILRELNLAIAHVKQILNNTDKRYKYDDLVRAKLEYVLKKLEHIYDVVTHCEQ
jgi:hypothetical protein